MHYTDGVPEYHEPTILWRMKRGPSRAHATVFAGLGQVTIAWFFDGTMDRVENYDSVDLAVARAEHIRGVLERDGWTMDEQKVDADQKQLACGCRVRTSRDFIGRVVGTILERGDGCTKNDHVSGGVVLMPGREHARPE